MIHTSVEFLCELLAGDIGAGTDGGGGGGGGSGSGGDHGCRSSEDWEW